MKQFFSPSTQGFYRDDVHAVMPADVCQVSDELYAEVFAGISAGKVLSVGVGGSPTVVDKPELTVEERAALLLRAVDIHLNSAARARGYDDIRSAALRAGYPGRWHDEGVTFAVWMDDCYGVCYELLARFRTGDIAEPTEAEVISALPPLVLPA